MLNPLLMLPQALQIGTRAFARVESIAADGKRTCNFLRERQLFETRASDVFVASYPRSGTTWLQFMVYLLAGHTRLDFTHFGQVSPWFERGLAVGSTRASDLNQLPNIRVFKTHLPPQWLPLQGRHIYVWREGADVAVSYYHLYQSHLGFKGSFLEFLQRFMQGRVQYRGWADHVKNWQSWANANRALILRYEDLKRDPAQALTQVADFLNLELPEHKLQFVLKTSAFSAMKARESQFDHATAVMLEKGLLPNQFIRKGEVGAGNTAVDPKSRSMLAGSLAKPQRQPRRWQLPDFLH